MARAEATIQRMPDRARSYDARYTYAALAMIDGFLDKQLIPGQADKFFGFDLNEEGFLPGRSLGRVRSIGSALFTLRRLRCFEDFHRRLMTRDLPGVFWECFWAHALSQDGFKIVAVRERNVRGEDFDFTAIKSGTRICVEVTGLTAPEFGENTVYNALNQKRSQLNPEKPGVVICVLPENWLEADGLHSGIDSACTRLFRSSQRVNAVIFSSEIYRPVVGRPGQTLYQYPLIRRFHERPRYPVPDLEHELLRPDRIENGILKTASPEEGNRTTNNMRTRPFNMWVDQLLDGE